jgi:hypothetical protein
MGTQHWFMLIVVLIVGMFVEKYMDPLGKFGL